jgi:hypothetical protein
VQFFSLAPFCRQKAAFCDVLADGDVLDGLVDVPSAKAPPLRPMIAIAAPRVVIRIAFLQVNLPSGKTRARYDSSSRNTIQSVNFSRPAEVPAGQNTERWLDHWL